ncbi:hypothetical protein AGMMS49965_07020 [Bacteroidia bacterium]|nr:hypothetical protein AGMMS49965_07020 [Bacteroidia bacterium]
MAYAGRLNPNNELIKSATFFIFRMTSNEYKIKKSRKVTNILLDYNDNFKKSELNFVKVVFFCYYPK